MTPVRSLAPGTRTIRMCSFDGRSGTSTGVISWERNEHAWRDHIDGCCSLDGRNLDIPRPLPGREGARTERSTVI